jgi:hypothetical protein
LVNLPKCTQAGRKKPTMSEPLRSCERLPHRPVAVLLHWGDDAPAAERPTAQRVIDPAA